MAKFVTLRDLTVYEDDHVMMVNKPAGMASLNERNPDQMTLIDLVKKEHPQYQLCHRLDKETSGLLVIAKDPETYRSMAMAFEQRKVTKIYHAVVSGVLNVHRQSIVLPIAVLKNGTARINMQEGKPAETIVTTLEMFGHYTLVECIPVSGRLHQIRVHLASQHFPIVCDTTYGGKIPYLSALKRNFKTSKWENEQGMMQRVALHARSIAFELNGKTYEVSAPYPKDFAVLLKLLDKNDRVSGQIGG